LVKIHNVGKQFGIDGYGWLLVHGLDGTQEMGNYNHYDATDGHSKEHQVLAQGHLLVPVNNSDSAIMVEAH
jgi:hypothetical protein